MQLDSLSQRAKHFISLTKNCQANSVEIITSNTGHPKLIRCDTCKSIKVNIKTKFF